MRGKTLAMLFPLFALAACGGSGQAPLNLGGLWYGVTAGDIATYDNPQVITQSGRDLVVTACDRSTTALRLEGERLVYRDSAAAGASFWVQPAGEGLMTGFRGASAGSELRRFSNAARFESGRVALGVPSVAPLQASQDVCARRGGQAYTLENGMEIPVRTVLVTAPHLGSFTTLRLAFQSLRAGDFAARERNGFLQNPGNAVHVELQSPAYVAAYGQDTLKINGGTVRVGVAANGVYTFDGVLVTDTGAQVSLSAELTLERRP